MDVDQKEFADKKAGIEKEIRLLFKANMKIFDWDIPENNEREAARLIITAIEEAVNKLKDDVEAGKFDNY